MNAEEEPEIIMSDLCADVEVDGHFLTVDIYKSDIDPGWILECFPPLQATSLTAVSIAAHRHPQGPFRAAK